MTLTYNPLDALGIRIGTPDQDSFLAQHEVMLAEEFGEAFVFDLKRGLKGDLPAAWRIADILAPRGVFQIGPETNDYITVTHTTGSMKIRTVPPIVRSPALVLVAAAISVYGIALRK